MPFYTNTQKELKYEIGGMTLLFKTESPVMGGRIKSHYKDYVSDRPPDITIEIKQIKSLARPLLSKVTYRTPLWTLGLQGGLPLLYFHINRIIPCIGKFNKDMRRVDFYTSDTQGQLFLYLIPEILLSLLLPRKNALMFHACGVIDRERGYLFVASSGGGKSTLAKMALKGKLTVLNDDRVIVRKEGKIFKMFGTPWHGEVAVTANDSAVIRQIFFLRKSSHNKTVVLSAAKAMKELLRNCFFIYSNNDIIKNKLCFDMIENLKCYRLHFSRYNPVWSFLYAISQEDSF